MTLSPSHNKRGVTPAKAMVAAISGYAMDGFDLLILGFMLPAISASLALSPSQAGSLVTWTLIGAVLGGIFFGHLSDRLGRIRVLTFTILMFSAFTGLCAIAQGYWDLLTYRTLAGMGLGGEFGIGMALIAEAWPANKRNRASAWVGIGWQLGVLLAAFITPLLLGIIGWRGMFLVGLLPALASFAIRRGMGEPEAFTQHQQISQQLSFPARLKLLFADAATAKASLGIFILCSVQNFGYYGLMIWMPSYLSSSFGFSLTKSGLWTAVTVVGMTFGIWLFGTLADRFARWKIFLIYQIGAVVMVIVYAQLRDPTIMLFAGALMGLFVNGMIGGYGALISDTYPLKMRATAQNVLFNLGRGVGGFGPLTIGLLVSQWSFSAAITLLALLYLLDIFATLFLLPKKQGQEDALRAIG
ncbi:TPA: MFS transporter [Klebsiella quasipneumoniae subsp. quasipneumoniae]|uniref:MFS transporter n=1 Tax=Klebsiella pneumoniae complex TaxID=3390273 RepID=UPI000D59DC25|nr:MFS transporter [Klebsiella pneumoniae]HBW1846821.1 MFS transporter [Klebsiella quasipneumoniae subsp. quasipneumoniae]HCM5370784.1 MFS transporter [Klebsiella variicola subsp. variicola]HDS6868547.1 MFS transporter [Klebsiella pneumoniae subsp. pneumoniae]HBX8239886.1 MFS transporter [Klebsiella pneumoniae]HCM7678358.1 MFS transporter [Klebsiella quasipneumoniae subsp. quasipneumoniae]